MFDPEQGLLCCSWWKKKEGLTMDKTEAIKEAIETYRQIVNEDKRFVGFVEDTGGFYRGCLNEAEQTLDKDTEVLNLLQEVLKGYE